MSTDLNANAEALVLWFDDLGTGNEDFRFLSNFFEGEPFTIPGITWEAFLAACDAQVRAEASHDGLLDSLQGEIPWLTGEHAFAAMKFWGTDLGHFLNIVLAAGYSFVASKGEDKGKTIHVSAPSEAKSKGRSRRHPLRADWEAVKYDVMLAVLRSKFTLDRAEGQALLKTGDALLVEGTWWHDEVWGVNLYGKDLYGRNWLGTMLMARRAELRAQAAFGLENGMVHHFATNTGVANADYSMEGLL